MASRAIKFNHHAVLRSARYSVHKYDALLHVQPLQHTLTSLCNSHLILKVQSLLPTLTRHSRMSQDHVFHIICCLMSTEMSLDSFSLNDLWSDLLNHFFSSCCLKYELLTDFLANLIGNGFYKEAKNEYNSVWAKRTMTFVTVDIYELISASCVTLCDFMSCVDELTYSFLPSQQNDMVLDQVLNSWNAILRKRPATLDFIIPRILDIYIHKNEIDQALDCLVSYKNLNRDNLNAYVYIFKFLVKYGKEDEETNAITEDCFHKIVEFSPDSPLILEMLDYCKVGSRYTCAILMEFVDYLNNKDNLKAWEKLYIYLERLNPPEMDTIQDHYDSIYSSYWPEYHWKSVVNGVKEDSNKLSELPDWKEKVYQMLVVKPRYFASNSRKKSSLKLLVHSSPKKPKLEKSEIIQEENIPSQR